MPSTPHTFSRSGFLPAALAMVGALALLLSGCASSTTNGSGAPSRTTPTTPAPGTATAMTKPAHTSAPTAAQRLGSITLQVGDLPPAWKATPYEDDPSDADDDAAMMACVGGRNTDPDYTGEAHSPDYSDGNATVSSDAGSYRSEADVDADVAMVHSPKLKACFQQFIRSEAKSSLPAGTTLDTFLINITPDPAGVPSNVIATIAATAKIDVSGQTVVVYMNFAMIIGPLIEAEIDFTNVGAPVPVALREQLTKKVADRAAHA